MPAPDDSAGSRGFFVSDDVMTRQEARQKAVELWGEMGLVGRAITILTGATLLIGLVTAFKRTADTFYVPLPAFQKYVYQRDSALARMLYHRDSTQAMWLLEDRQFKTEMRTWRYQECANRYGPGKCTHLPTK